LGNADGFLPRVPAWHGAFSCAFGYAGGYNFRPR
jgi:hypothetical protein